MAQKQASNSFKIEQIIDGDSVQGGLIATTSLSQMYNTTSSACVPDWTVAANQPIIYPNMYLGSEGGTAAKQVSNPKWYYNDVEILFGANNVSTNFGGAFRRLPSYNNGTITVEAVKIVKNLAASANMDNDIIRLEGSVEASGHGISITREINVRISEFSGSGYLGVISALDTVNNIATCQFDNDTSSLKMTGKLYGSDGQEASSYSCKWYINGGSTVIGSGKSLVLTKDNVDAHAVLRCDFLVGNDVVYSDYIDLYDLTDPYYIGFVWSTPTTIGSADTARGQAKVYKSDGTEASGTWTFTANLTDARGAAYSNSLATVSSTGAISVAGSILATAGGQITGYVTATLN